MKRNQWLTGLILMLTAAAACAGVQQRRVDAVRQQMIREVLRADWNTALFLLNFENGRPAFFYDHRDPTQTEVVARVQRFMVVKDGAGVVLIHPQQPGNANLAQINSDGFSEIDSNGKRVTTYSGVARLGTGKSYRITLARPTGE